MINKSNRPKHANKPARERANANPVPYNRNLVGTVKPAQRRTAATATPTIHIIGCGIAGLMTAFDLVAAFMSAGQPIRVVIYEPGPNTARGLEASSPRCQMWVHSGILWVVGAPEVTLNVRRSVARLKALAPEAFDSHLALVSVSPSIADATNLESSASALGVNVRSVPSAVAANWLRGKAQPPDAAHFLRTDDGTANLALLVRGLTAHLKSPYVEFVHATVQRLLTTGDRVSALQLDEGVRVQLGHEDSVVVTAGPASRPLLRRSDLAVPGLRIFQSNLASSRTAGIPFLYAAYGTVNCVPHRQRDGDIINIIGDRGRTEVHPDEDETPRPPNAEEIGNMRELVSQDLGIATLEIDMAWSARKAELVQPGQVRNQGHHTLLIPQTSNAWLGLPGKLSQSAAMSMDLARLIVGRALGPDTARSIWDKEGAGRLAPAWA